MASAFNLTAQLNLRGPSNVRQIVSDIRRELGTITGDINLRVNTQATRNITQLNSAIRTLNDALVTTRGNATQAANAISAFANAANSINRATASTSRNITNVTSATQRLTAEQGRAAKNISKSSSEMEEFGRQAALAVRRFAAYSTAAGAVLSLTSALKGGLSAFIDYEKEFVKLQQVTDKTAAQLSGLDREISRLSVGLGVSSDELIKVSSTLAQAGLSARDTQKALQALALTDLAPSFDNLNDTVEGSIALMRQFSIGAGQLEQALGSVNAVAAAFAVESSDLISAIQRTGGVFASASKGVSDGTKALNEFLAVFTSVRQTTRESAETIATGLRTIFTRIQREDTIEALREYGVNLTDVEGKFVGAYKAVQLLSEGLGRIDPRDLKFSQIVEELGGFRQIGKVIPLIQQFSVAQEALGVAQRGSGSLAKDAVTAQLSLANQIKKVREEFLALMRSIGSGDTFQTLAKGALGFASALIKIADSVKGILPILAIIGAGTAARAISRFGTGFVGGLRRTGDEGGGGGNTPRPSPIFGGGGGSNMPANLPRDLSLLDDILRTNTRAIDNLRTSLTGVSSALGSMDQFSLAIQANTASLASNTAGLASLTTVQSASLTAIETLTSTISGMGDVSGSVRGSADHIYQSMLDLTMAIRDLDNSLKTRGSGPSAGLNSGGVVRKFARGGVVPGSGNSDTIPAMLMPGEFVIRKKAVETIGADNLHNMNKYGSGGSIRSGKSNRRKKFAGGGPAIAEIQSVEEVVDGDTFDAQVVPKSEPYKARFRLLNYDAYETGSRYSKITPDKWNTISKYPSNAEIKDKVKQTRDGSFKIPPNTIVGRGGLTAASAGSKATDDLITFIEQTNKNDLLNKINNKKDVGFGRIGIDLTKVFGSSYVTGRYVDDDTDEYALGGKIQKFMAGGKATAVQFGTGETKFPKRITNAYAKELQKKIDLERVNNAFDPYPSNERITIDPAEVAQKFQSESFDRKRFLSLFNTKISRNELMGNLSDFAKFIGLPGEDLSKVLPQTIDFGGELQRYGNRGTFSRDPFGTQGYDTKGLEGFGFTTADEQDLFGYQKLMEEKEKEIKKILKTPVATYEDGSFSYDSVAFNKAMDEKSALGKKISEVMDKRAVARKGLMEQKKEVLTSTGRGFVSMASNAFEKNQPKNVLYHELTHQLLNSLRTQSEDSFTKYKERVSQLFSGDNDDLADAFDALGSSYNSADVVYGRSYKNGLLDYVLQDLRRGTISSGGRSPNPELSKEAYSMWVESGAKKNAREYRPINPKINEILLKGGQKQETIDKVEDYGKEEFLTTLIQNAPKLDANMQGILDSTLNELLGNAGITRQTYAEGGKVTRNLGYIDFDIINDPANADVIEQAMKKAGVDGPRKYTEYLMNLATKARKDTSIKKLTALYGVAGAGKSSIAMGRGANDIGTLRQTNRFPILTPEDISKASEVMLLSSTVSQDKLEGMFKEADKIYGLSTTTQEEKDRVRKQRTMRDVSGIGLFGREAGSTTGAPTDTAKEEALLMDRFGDKTMILGRGDSNRLRRKRGNELVEITKKKLAFTWGGFAPTTAGHESIMEAAKAAGIPYEDFIALVGANESIDAKSYRTAVFDQDFRLALAKAGFGSKGASVLPKAFGDMSVPLAFDMGEKDGRRQITLAGEGSMAFVADKTEQQMEKYRRAGYGVSNLERTGGISGTQVRDLLLSGDLEGLQKIVSPGVFSLLRDNISQLQNRANVLPVLIEQAEASYKQEVAAIDEQLAATGITRANNKKAETDPEYAAQLKLYQSLKEKKKKLETKKSFEPYRLLRQLADSDPAKYGLRFNTVSSGASGPSSAIQQAILEKVTKQTAVKRSSGILPAEGREILKRFGAERLPIDTMFGPFAGKTVRDTAEGGKLKYWNSAFRPETKADKLAYYTATRDYLIDKFNESQGSQRATALKDTTNAVLSSAQLGLVGLNPLGYTGLLGPETWNLGTDQLGQERSITASIVQRGLPTQYQNVIDYLSGQTEEIVGGAAKLLGIAPKKLSKKQRETLGQGNIEGALLEQIFGSADATILDDALRTRPIDFPMGIGSKAAQIFGIDPDIPTEVKRTIDSNSRGKAVEEFQRYFRQQYGIPDPDKVAPQAFASGGKVDPLLEKYKSVIASIMPPEYIGKDGFLMTPGGESYEVGIGKSTLLNLANMFFPQVGYTTQGSYSTLLSTLRANKDKFSDEDFARLSNNIKAKFESEQQKIGIGFRSGSLIPHEAFHTIQSFLSTNYPDTYDKLLGSALLNKNKFIDIYKKSKMQKSMAKYSIDTLFADKSTLKQSSYARSGDILTSQIPGTESIKEDFIAQMGANEIIPALLDMSTIYKESAAKELLSTIFRDSGLNANFFENMPQKFWFGGKVDPLAKKYGITQKEFLEQKKIAEAMGLDPSQLEEKLSLYVTQKKRLKEKKFAALDATADASIAGKRATDQQKALEEYFKQNKFAGGGKIKLYHGSNTGIDDNVLKSFKEKGALSNIATGYGQGAGFYLYTEKNKAEQQARMRVNGSNGFVTTSGDTSGKPMVLSFDEMLDPKTFDLDYEIQKGLVIQWMHDNYDSLKDKYAASPDQTGFRGKLNKNPAAGLMSNGIRIQEGPKTAISEDGTEYILPGRGIKSIYAGTEGDIREGELIGQLMARIKAGDPDLVNQFESKVFEKPLGLAVKYVGQSPLKPTNYEFFANGGSAEDTVPALLTPGEFVINRKAAERIGYGKLETLNKADKLQGYNKGGAVGGRLRFAGGGRAPGDEEASIQRLMIELETLTRSVRDTAYAERRRAGISASVAKQQADYQATLALQTDAIARLAAATTSAERTVINEATRRVETDMADRRRSVPPPAPPDPEVGRRADNQYIAMQARLRGVTEVNYRNELRKQAIQRGVELRENLPTNIDRFRSRTYQLRDTIAGPDSENRTNAIDELRTMLREISSPDVSDETLNRALDGLAANLNDTSMTFNEAIDSTGSLVDILDTAGTEGAIFDKVISEMSAATRISDRTLRTMFNPAAIEGAIAARRNRQSIDTFITRVNRVSLTLGAASSLISKVMEAPENRGSTVSSAGISGALGGTGQALAFGGQFAANVSQLSELSGETGAIGALGGAAQSLMNFIANPITAAVAVAGAALYGLAAGVKDATNAAREFDKNLANKNLENSLERVNRLFDDFSKDKKNIRILKDIDKEINKAISSALASARIEAEVPKAFWVNLIDVISSGNTREAAERSNILEKQGISAYFESTRFGQFLQGNIFNGRQEADQARQFYTGLNTPDMAKNQAATLKPITDALMKESEERLRAGENFSAIIDSLYDGSGGPSLQAENIARSNPAIQEQLMRVESSDLSEREKQNRKDLLILNESEYRLRLNLQKVLKDIEMERLSNATRKFVTSIERMLSNMDRAINKVTFQLDRMTQSADLSNAALSGQAKAGEVSLDSINILQNRRAYSNERQNFAVNQASEMFGQAGGIIRPLLNIGDKMEDTILSTINRVISENPGVPTSDEKLSGAIRSSLNTALGDLGLPDDLTEKMSKAVQDGFGELRQKQDDNTVSFDQLVEKVPQLAQTIDVAKAAQERAIKALEFWQKSVNDYANAMNQAMEQQIEANNYFRKATSIENKGSTELSRALGRVVTLTDQFAQSRKEISAQTGGATNPRAIENNILMLENRRRTQQELSNQAANAGLGGRNELTIMQSRLRLTNTALRENYDALKRMAESGDLASAALAKLSEIEQKRQAGVSFIEKLVTSDASELDSFNRALSRLNNNMQGKTNLSATPQDRSESLQAFNMIAPFLGPQQNEIKANILESMLQESGIGVGGFSNDIIKSLRNPEASPEAKEAINFYNEAISLQSKANDSLGKIQQLMAENTAEIAAQKLATAIQGVQLSFDSQVLTEIRNGINRLVELAQGAGVVTPAPKSAGGIIYASAGEHINFKPKGTDTVPAMLTPGEFVVNRQATSKNLPLLKQINSGMSYYADGGIVVDGVGANKGKWAKVGYDAAKAAEDRKNIDLETKKSYPTIRDLNRAKTYNDMTSVWAAPSIFYAASRQGGQLGESFMMSADDTPRFFRKDIEAIPGVGPHKISINMSKFDNNPLIDGRDFRSTTSQLKNIGYIPNKLEDIIYYPIRSEKISKNQLEDYKQAYQHLKSKLELSKNLFNIKEEDFTKQQNNARRELEKSVKLDVRPRTMFDSGLASLDGLTFKSTEAQNKFLFMGNGANRPRLDTFGEKGNILGIDQSKPWYKRLAMIDAIDHTVVGGINSMKGNSAIGRAINDNSISYDSATLSSPYISNKASLSKDIFNILDSKINELSSDSLVESQKSLGRKSLVSKLEDLYYNRIFQATFGSELFNAVNGVQLPLTLYNMDKEAWLRNLSSQPVGQRGKSFSWNDDDFISLSPSQIAGGPISQERILPWVGSDFSDENIFEKAKKEFGGVKQKLISMVTKMYGTEGSGDLNMMYDEVSAYPFDKTTGQFDYSNLMKYLVIKQASQDGGFNPGSPFADMAAGSKLYWAGDIESLAQYVRDRTPSIDPKTGKESPAKLGMGYTYPFMTMGAGLINALSPEDFASINNNLAFRELSSSEQQDLLLRSGVDQYNLSSFTLKSPGYKLSAARRKQLMRDKAATQKVTGAGQMVLDKGNNESFTSAKRVTLARELYKILDPIVGIGGGVPTKLSDVANISQSLNSRLENISKTSGVKSEAYSKVRAAAAIFSSMYSPDSGIAGYFKRMGVPLSDADFDGPIPVPADPTKPFRSKIDYYTGFSKKNDVNQIVSSLKLITQRELDYWRADAGTKRLTEEGRTRATAIGQNFQDANIGRDTGDITYKDPKKEIEIQSYQDIEKLALNPYSIPQSYLDRQQLLDELYDYYKTDVDDNDKPIWPENRWKFIGENAPAVANPNLVDGSDIKEPSSIRDWYAIQDRIINNAKTKAEIDEQIQVLTDDKLGNRYLPSNILDTFSSKAQEWNKYLTGNLFGMLPDYKYMLGWLKDKSEPNIAAIPKSTGGVIYASTGKYIDFQPKGTDTIPAMLTPGEFVVNKKATESNLPLLQSMNRGEKPIYRLFGSKKPESKNVAQGSWDSGVAQASWDPDIAQVGWEYNPGKGPKPKAPTVPAPTMPTKPDNAPTAPSNNAPPTASTSAPPLPIPIDYKKDAPTTQTTSKPGKTKTSADNSPYANKEKASVNIQAESLANNFAEKLVGMKSNEVSLTLRDNMGVKAISGKLTGYDFLSDTVQVLKDISSKLLGDELSKIEVLSLKDLSPETQSSIRSIMMKKELSVDRPYPYQTRGINNLIAKLEQQFGSNAMRGYRDPSRINKVNIDGKDIYDVAQGYISSRIDLSDLMRQINKENRDKLANETKKTAVYASTGKYFQPRGTDTIPAMLTPGEFVVNKEATQKNLPLLQQMNKGGKVIYRARGSDKPEDPNNPLNLVSVSVDGVDFPPTSKENFRRRMARIPLSAWMTGTAPEEYAKILREEMGEGRLKVREDLERQRSAASQRLSQSPSRAQLLSRPNQQQYQKPSPEQPKRGQASVNIPPQDRKPISVQTNKSPISPPKQSESAQAEPIKPVGSIIVTGRSSIPSQSPTVTLTPADVAKTQAATTSVFENKDRVWYGGRKWDLNNDGKESETITGNINKILDTQRVMINTNNVPGKLLILRKEYMNAEDLSAIKAFEDQLKTKAATSQKINRTNDQTVLPQRPTDPVIQQSRTGENYLTVSGRTSNTSVSGQPQILKLDQKDAAVEDILNKSRTWYNGKLWDINNDGKAEELTIGPISKILQDGKILINPRKTWKGQPDSNNGLILSSKNLTQEDIDFVNMWKKQNEDKKKAKAMTNGGLVYAQYGYDPTVGTTLSLDRQGYEQRPRTNTAPNRPGIFGDGRMPSAAGTTPMVSNIGPKVSTIKPETTPPGNFGTGTAPKNAGIMTNTGTKPIIMSTDLNNIDPNTTKPMVYGPKGFKDLVRSGQTPQSTTQVLTKADLQTNRVWYNGKLWDQNRDGKESPNEKLIGTLDDVALDGDVRIIREKDWGYGKVLRLDPRNFAKYSTPEDQAIVQTWLNLGKKKSPAAIEPTRRFANGGVVYAANGSNTPEGLNQRAPKYWWSQPDGARKLYWDIVGSSPAAIDPTITLYNRDNPGSPKKANGSKWSNEDWTRWSDYVNQANLKAYQDNLVWQEQRRAAEKAYYARQQQEKLAANATENSRDWQWTTGRSWSSFFGFPTTGNVSDQTKAFLGGVLKNAIPTTLGVLGSVAGGVLGSTLGPAGTFGGTFVGAAAGNQLGNIINNWIYEAIKNQDIVKNFEEIMDQNPQSAVAGGVATQVAGFASGMGSIPTKFTKFQDTLTQSGIKALQGFVSTQEARLATMPGSPVIDIARNGLKNIVEKVGKSIADSSGPAVSSLRKFVTDFITDAAKNEGQDRYSELYNDGTVLGRPVPGFMGGGLIYASNGQLVNFQPKGTDTVPAMLTPGEFVINRKATQNNLSLLKAINNGSYSHGDIVKKFNRGGVVNPGYYQLGGNVDRSNNFDFGSFMQRLMGQLSSVIGTSLREGLQARNNAQNVQQTSNGVSIDSKTLNSIGELTNRLKSIADTLAGLNGIPSEIKVTGRHDVNVIINGDSVLNKLSPEIQDIVMNEIKNSFNKLVNANKPMPSDKLINPFDLPQS